MPIGDSALWPSAIGGGSLKSRFGRRNSNSGIKSGTETAEFLKPAAGYGIQLAKSREKRGGIFDNGRKTHTARHSCVSAAKIVRDCLRNRCGVDRPLKNGGIGDGGVEKSALSVSLAHNGVLFLDELPEFPRNVLEML